MTIVVGRRIDFSGRRKETIVCCGKMPEIVEAEADSVDSNKAQFTFFILFSSTNLIFV